MKLPLTADRLATLLAEIDTQKERRSRWSFKAMKKALGGLMSEFDRARVAYAALMIQDDDRENFSSASMTYSRVEAYTPAEMGYPEKAWHYVLWAHLLEPGELRDRVDYWLGIVVDNTRAGDHKRVMVAIDRLADLWDEGMILA